MGKRLTFTDGIPKEIKSDREERLTREVNELREIVPEWVPPGMLNTSVPFSNLFPKREQDMERLVRAMKESGFDPNEPITLGVFPMGEFVVDGNSRLAAAKIACLPSVAVVRKNFESIDDGLAYAIHRQRDRRNLTDKELFLYIDLVDEKKERGRGGEGSGRSAEITAKAIGTSATKVKKARAVKERGSDDLLDDVREGRKSVNQAYNEVMGKNPDEKPAVPIVGDPRAFSIAVMKVIHHLDDRKIIALKAHIEILHLVEEYTGVKIDV